MRSASRRWKPTLSARCGESMRPWPFLTSNRWSLPYGGMWSPCPATRRTRCRSFRLTCGSESPGSGDGALKSGATRWSLVHLRGPLSPPDKEFGEALRTRKYREAHRRALRHAYEEAGVTGVPMFVIGDQVLTGLQDRETLEAVIEEELARQTARR